MTTAPFDQLQADLQGDGIEAGLERLAEWFQAEKRFHELFDTRLMQARRRLGLPIILTTPLDDLAEPLRGEVESAYLAACREAGWLLWNDGEIRQAWMYLRPLGDPPGVAAALAKVEPTEENRNELIEIALHEGVDPALGLQWVINQFGTCNAITAYDSEVPRFRRSQQQAAAAVMVRHLHGELVGNIRSEIARHDVARHDVAQADGGEPNDTTLDALLRDRNWLFSENSYHIDASHLASVVRIARIVEDAASLRFAWDLTQYGRRLSETFQLTGDEPFADVYPSHGLFFGAQLGMQVEEALAFFRDKAERAVPEDEGTAAAEVYIVLLVRLGRFAEAMAAHVKLIPPNVRASGFAPTLLELGRLAEDYDQLTNICRERGDLLGFAAGMIAKQA
jgi:hypothetical protein